MTTTSPRLIRERKTIQAMIRLYCREQHHPAEQLCSDCQQIDAYALARLNRCVYQAEKPTCANCPVHCYKPDMREEVRAIMRYAGPRMLLHHPVMAILHLLDGRRKAPDLKKNRN